MPRYSAYTPPRHGSCGHATGFTQDVPPTRTHEQAACLDASGACTFGTSKQKSKSESQFNVGISALCPSRVISACRRRKGPCAMAVLHAGMPLVVRFDHGNSRHPYPLDLIIALAILPFCLNTAWVMRSTMLLFHTGIQFKLGIA